MTPPRTRRPGLELTERAEALLRLWPGEIPAVVVERALHELAVSTGRINPRTAARRQT